MFYFSLHYFNYYDDLNDYLYNDLFFLLLLNYLFHLQLPMEPTFVFFFYDNMNVAYIKQVFQ